MVVITKFVSCQQHTLMTTTNLTSINSIKEKMLSPSLDPKLRRALLRVLSKLEKDSLPIDPDAELSDEDFIKIFGQSPAQSVDLGSIDSKEIMDDKEKKSFIAKRIHEQMKLDNKIKENYNGNLYTYIPPSDVMKKNSSQSNQSNQSNQSVDSFSFQGYTYIPPPTVASNESSDKTDSPINPPTKPTPEQNEVYFQVPTPIDIPDQVEEMTPETFNEKQMMNTEIMEEVTDTLPMKEMELSELINMEDMDEDDEANTTSISITQSVTRDVSESKNADNNVTDKMRKHEVEFFPSALVAAFTVQQDDKGIPRKVIPLDYVNQQKLLIENKQKELADKEFRLQQQLISLQEEKYRFHGALKIDGIIPKIRLPNIANQYFSKVNNFPNVLELHQVKNFEQQRQEEIERLQNLDRERLKNNLKQQEIERQELIRQQEINRIKERQRQQELRRKQELERYQQLQRQREVQNFNRPFAQTDSVFSQNQQLVDFQKSVDYRVTATGVISNRQPPPFGTLSAYQRFPNGELNRVHRQEPQQIVGNFGRNPHHNGVDFQLQNLIAQSGVSSFVPHANKDDLNIVSKVLSLNHHGNAANNDNIGRHSEVTLYLTPPPHVIHRPI